LLEPRDEWFRTPWWEERIGSAICTDDPVVCNLRITMAHYELSLALREVLGAGTGANFHTWATWGSKKAGITIRQEDIPGLRRFALVAGGTLGAVASGVARAGDKKQKAEGSGRIAALRFAPPAFWTTLLSGLSCYAFAGKMLDISTQQIVGGNITVLDDIGHATARFIYAFRDHPEPDKARLAEFLGTLRQGPTQEGGQGLLKDAFTNYYLARHQPDPNARDEHMLLANLSAILHEHMRLQPYIAGSMPHPLRRLVTARLLHYQVGPDQLSVDQDVPEWSGPGAPTDLGIIQNPDLLRFLDGPGGWDRTPDSYTGSRARDWSDIHDRMNYICDLFRSRQFDPALYNQPYTEEQCACLWDGRVPMGPL
jgi:hypothetical protein